MPTPFEYLDNYPDYLRGVRNCTDNTVKSYMYDAKRYLNFFTSQIDSSLETFDITPKLIREYSIYLHLVIKNDVATIERRLHGVTSFWLYLHLQYDFSLPVSLRFCGIQNIKKRNPTPPIQKDSFKKILKDIEHELSKIK